MDRIKERKNWKMKKMFVNLAYVSIILTIIGQCTVGAAFYVGQGAYCIANIINCTRDVALKRPAADKIKNFSFLGITVGLMLFNYFVKGF